MCWQMSSGTTGCDAALSSCVKKPKQNTEKPQIYTTEVILLSNKRPAYSKNTIQPSRVALVHRTTFTRVTTVEKGGWLGESSGMKTSWASLTEAHAEQAPASPCLLPQGMPTPQAPRHTGLHRPHRATAVCCRTGLEAANRRALTQSPKAVVRSVVSSIHQFCSRLFPHSVEASKENAAQIYFSNQ